MQKMKEEKEVTMALKLLINMEGEKAKVLYAEANKGFVDFLFNIMSLPLGTILELIQSKDNMAGCLGDLYKSIESLNPDYLQDNVNRDAVLRPRPSVSVPLLSINNNNSEDVDNNPSFPSAPPFPLHNDEAPVVIDDNNNIVEKPSNKTGYVKGGVLSYMVMDNLEVKPMSTNSVVFLMKKYNVKDASLLTERVVQVGFSQGVAILKKSLETRAVLTNVFLESINLHLGINRGSGVSGRDVLKRKSRWNCYR